MSENKSIDNKTWYVTDSVGDITTELNMLFRATNGYKIHKANTVFHCILTTNKTRNIRLYFTYPGDPKDLKRILNGNVDKAPGPSPLSIWFKDNKNNRAYGVNYDPRASISAPFTNNKQDEINLEPIGPNRLPTEFSSAVEKLRESERPRLLSLVIGKYNTDEDQTAISNNNQSKEDNSQDNQDIISEISRKYSENMKYGRCKDSCHGKAKYIVKPIELCPDKGILSRNKVPIGAYKSLAPKVSDASIVEYDVDKAISEIVYQSLPPEIVYRTSINPFTNRNGKSTIILVGDDVNSVLGTNGV